MKRIYTMYSDDMYFQGLGTRNEQDALKLNCHPPLPKELGWSPPELMIYGADLRRGDFFHSSPDRLIVNSKALTTLRPFFERAGEILPLFHEGESFALINILKVYEILDFYQIERDHFGYPSKLAFKTSFRPEPGLFKSTGVSGVLAFVDSEDLSTNFFHAVRSNELEGLRFEPVWSSEEES